MRLLVVDNRNGLATCFYLDSGGLSLEQTLLDCVLGTRKALNRKIIHRLAGDAMFIGCGLSEAAHCTARVGVFQSVHEHMVINLCMA